MVHKPKHKVHSFRGLLGDGGQDEINLERQNVNLAYRIVKFEVMANDPSETTESAMKIYREEQTSATAVIDFTEVDLLGACIYQSSSAGETYPIDRIVIFDNTLFSRNIYVTLLGVTTGRPLNYYIEIEEVPVNAATLMQLKLGVARKLSLTEGPYIPPS